MIVGIRGRRAASHPDPSELKIGGHVEHSGLCKIGLVVPHDPAVVGKIILVRGPGDIDGPVDQGEGWTLVLLSRVESRRQTSIARSRKGSRDRHRAAGFLAPGESVNRVKSLEKG